MQPDRPTFHDAWHRIAALRPRLRPSVQVVRQVFRGEPWHIVQDSSGTDYARLNASGAMFLGLLNGMRTVQECWDICNTAMGDASPTQGEVVQLLGKLYTANLLSAEVSGDADAMLRRYQKRRSREFRSYLSSVLFLRVPLWNPDRFLSQWSFAFAWLFSPMGLLLWITLLIAGLWQLAGRFEELRSGASSVLAPTNLFLLYITFVVTKLVHELGHGVAAKVFGLRQGTGGSVLQTGVMFLVFVPFPYVDTSSAWLLRSRMHRIIVAAAGMMFELVIAALAAFVWSRSADGTVLKGLMYNVMFVSGVSTIIFNANPLMRYDGYFMLADVLGMPNLANRANDYLKYLVKKHLWATPKLDARETDPTEQKWLVLYGIASFGYRMFVFAGIIWFVAQQWFIIGLIAAAFCTITFAVVPIFKLIKYLATHTEIARNRTRAILSTSGVAAALLAILGLIPVPDHVRVEGIVEPLRSSVVYTQADGFLKTIAPTSTLEMGVPLATASNPDLDVQVARLEARDARLQAQRRIAQTQDISEMQRISEQIRANADQLSYIRTLQQRLTLSAPFAGSFVSPKADEMPGAFAQRGTEVGVMQDTSVLTVRAFAPQWASAHLVDENPPLADVRARMRPSSRSDAQVLSVFAAGQDRLPSRSVALQAGGSLAVDASDPKGQRVQEPFFEWRMQLDKPQEFYPGQRVVARFRVSNKPLLSQGYRWLRQQIQRRFEV